MKNYLHNEFDPTELVQVFDELPLWSAPFGLKLLEVIDYKPNIHALDIGFGTGFPLTELAMRLGDTSTVYGIDPWTEAIERTKRKISFYGIKNIQIFEGVAESIPLESGTIDLIVSNNGLNNVQNLEQVLSECSRICKAGSQFVMTMNLDTTMFEFYDQLERVLREMNLDLSLQKMREHINEKRRPLAEMISMIHHHGFVIDDVIHDQFNYKFTNGTAMFNHYFIRMAFMDSWVNIIPADMVDQIFNVIEKRLNEETHMNGGINLSVPFVVINAIKNATA
jgi:ubiquinone/menaquinone biosynthesis C-methylase UbiE